MKTNTLLFCLAIICCRQLSAQTLDKKFASTDGTVYASVQNGDTVFIGGDFTQVGIGRKGLAKFTTGSDRPDINFPELGSTDGVNAMEPDGSGGFYLAGYFNSYDGVSIPETYIIHVLAGGVLDNVFRAVTIGEYWHGILALKKIKDRLYAGGSFQNIQGVDRPYLVALKSKTGDLDSSWIPDIPSNTVSQIDGNDSLVFVNIGGNNCQALKASNGKFIPSFPIPADGNPVSAFKVDSNTLYLGGGFGSIGNSTPGLGKVSSLDASQDVNFPSTYGSVRSKYGSGIWCILPDAHGGYYVGGEFSIIGGTSRSDLAHILANGTIDPAFNFDVDGLIESLATDGTNLYFCGEFTSVDGKDRYRVASIDCNTKKLTDFNPDVNDYVYTIAYTKGIIYIGGIFTLVNGTTRYRAAAIDVSSKKLTDWDPDLNDAAVKIIPDSDENFIFISGNFTQVNNGLSRPYIVKVDDSVGIATSWKPNPNGGVYSIILNGNTLYIKGAFTSVNGKQRNYFAGLDIHSNNPLTLKADLDTQQPFADINDLYINNNKLYIAGTFTAIQGVTRTNIARIDLNTGKVDSWNANDIIKPNNYLWSVYASGSNILLGGQFTAISPVQRDHLAAIDLTNNSFKINSWRPSTGYFQSYGSINSFYRYGNNLFVGGGFAYNDGTAVSNNIIAFNTTTGEVGYNFAAQYPDNAVYGITASNGTLTIAGYFDDIQNNGISVGARKHLASYTLNNFQLTKDIIYDPNGDLSGMFTDASGNLFISGGFSLTNYLDRQSLAAINLKTGLPTPFNPNPFVSSAPWGASNMYSLAIKDSILFTGGYFTNIGTNALARNDLAAINIKTGKAISWNANTDYEVKSLAIKDTILYAGGNFTNIKGTSRNYAAALSTTNAAVKPWDPNLNNTVNAILINNNNVYLGGNFTKVGSTSRKYLAKVDGTTAALASWNPNPNAVINTFTKDSVALYAGGDFSNISGKSIYGVAKYSLSADTIFTAFDPKLRNGSAAPFVNGLGLWGKTLFAGSDGTTKINGVNRGNLAGINTANDSATSFNPSPDNVVTGLTIGKSKLFAGGTWSALGKNVSPSYFAVFTLEPLAPASNLSFTNLQSTSVTANFTSGSGESRLVVIKQTTAPASPNDGRGYTANAAFKKGDTTATGSYVVYSGSGNTVNITKLVPKHKYIVNVYEYNGSGSGSDYLTAPALTGNFTTPCPVYNNLYVDSSGSLTICSGSSVTLTAPSGFTSYVWSNGSIANHITVDSSGTYFVTVTDNNGCQGTTRPVVVTVNQVPAPPSNITGPKNVPPNHSGLIYSVTNVGGLTYAWTVPPDAVITSGQGTNSIIVTWGSTAGNISVQAQNSCGSSTAKLLAVNIKNGFASFTKDGAIAAEIKYIKVYPNPASGPCTVVFTAQTVKQYTVQLTDIMGKILLSNTISSVAGINTIKLNVDHFANGLYLINIIDEDGLKYRTEVNKN